MDLESSILKVVGDDTAGHRPRPLRSREAWRLKIAGEIEREGEELTLDRLLALEPKPYEQEIEIECVSAGGICGIDKVAQFRGVRFRTIAEYAGLKAEPGDVRELEPIVEFTSYARACGGLKRERHRTHLPLRDCLDPEYGVMLATHVNGQELPYENGGYLRNIVGPKLFFYKAIKWLAEIRILHEPLDLHRGTWEEYAGYHNRARVELDERFEPRMRYVREVIRDEEGTLEDVSELVPPEEWLPTFEEMYAEEDLSRLIAAKLNKMYTMDRRKMPADYSGFKFKRDDFRAKIRGTSFKSCKFYGADMEGCNFSLSIFSNAQFSREDGSDPANLESCDFEGAKFHNANLRGVSMGKSVLTNAEFVSDSDYERETLLVRDLDVSKATNLSDRMKAWLKRNGANV